MWSEHGHKGSRFGLKLAHHRVYEATRWVCPQVAETSPFLGESICLPCDGLEYSHGVGVRSYPSGG